MLIELSCCPQPTEAYRCNICVVNMYYPYLCSWSWWVADQWHRVIIVSGRDMLALWNVVHLDQHPLHLLSFGNPVCRRWSGARQRGCCARSTGQPAYQFLQLAGNWMDMLVRCFFWSMLFKIIFCPWVKAKQNREHFLQIASESGQLTPILPTQLIRGPEWPNTLNTEKRLEAMGFAPAVLRDEG